MPKIGMTPTDSPLGLGTDYAVASRNVPAPCGLVSTVHDIGKYAAA